MDDLLDIVSKPAKPQSSAFDFMSGKTTQKPQKEVDLLDIGAPSQQKKE
jgi:hypothetical protein